MKYSENFENMKISVLDYKKNRRTANSQGSNFILKKSFEDEINENKNDHNDFLKIDIKQLNSLSSLDKLSKNQLDDDIED